MSELLMWVVAKGLKTLVIGSLSALSFGVDVASTLSNAWDGLDRPAVVVVAYDPQPFAVPAVAWAPMVCQVAGAAAVDVVDEAVETGEPGQPEAPTPPEAPEPVTEPEDEPDFLEKLGALVPPILVESLFPPDLLLPPPVVTPEAPAPPVAAEVPPPVPPAKRAT